MLSDRCLSVLSVCLSATLVHCGQTVGWIKMKLRTEVGLGPGHIVLDGRSSSPYPKGAQHPALFGPCLFWPNGWMDQDATWYGGRPRPRPHCVRLGLSSPSPKGAQQPPSSAHVYCNQRSPISATAEHLFQVLTT